MKNKGWFNVEKSVGMMLYLILVSGRKRRFFGVDI